MALISIVEKGINYTVHLRHHSDLDRQIVKSSFASVTIPVLQLTIPPGRGQLTTVEGIIRDTVRDLNISQTVRRVMDPPTATKIDEMLKALRDYIGIAEGEEDDDGGVGMDDEAVKQPHAETDEEKEQRPFKPFTMTLDDPSGNSFFQFVGGSNDPQWNMKAYNRSLEQNVELGLVAAADDPEGQAESDAPRVAEANRMQNVAEFEARRKEVLARALGDGAEGVIPDEIFSFPSTCSSCGHELETLMQQVNVPYFQVCQLQRVFVLELTESAEHHHHGYQLLCLWISGQRGQVWRRCVRKGQEDYSKNRR